MRLNWSDDEDRPGQFALWNANCRRSLKSKAGQRSLREFEAALVAMPAKRLIHGRLVDGDDVCAVGAYARHKGLDLSRFGLKPEAVDVGIAAGMPRLVVWEVVALNDMHLNLTPEDRYEKVLGWVRTQLVAT